MEASIDSVVRRLRAYASTARVTRTELARRAGLSVNALRDFHRHDWNPTVETLRRLEAIIPPEFEPAADGAAEEREHGRGTDTDSARTQHADGHAAASAMAQTADGRMG